MTNNIKLDLYKKMAVNCFCNPLTIIYNQNVGWLREHKPVLMAAIIGEVAQVAKAQGAELDLKATEKGVNEI